MSIAEGAAAHLAAASQKERAFPNTNPRIRDPGKSKVILRSLRDLQNKDVVSGG
jgi:hypothetical protein